MLRSDIYFFGTVITMIILVLASVVFDIELPYLTVFWWISLLPYVFVKLFWRKSKLFKWFNTKI